MSLIVTFNGANYIIPQTNEVGWGSNLDAYFVAIAAGCLQKTGGSFTLSAETDFGSSFGLKSLYYKSRETGISSAGILRLASASAGIGFRNNLGNGNLILTTNASDQLTFNGTPIGGSGIFLTDRAIVSDGSGNLTSATTTATEIGYVNGVTSAIQTQLNTKATDSLVVHLAGSETITGFKNFTTTPAITVAGTVQYNIKSTTAADGSTVYVQNDANNGLQLTSFGTTHGGSLAGHAIAGLGFIFADTSLLIESQGFISLAISNTEQVLVNSSGMTLTNPLGVASGGTGSGTHTAYAVLTGGTTPTGQLQSVAGVGSSGQVLTSNGPSALPTFQNAPGTGTVNSGTQYQLAYYATSTNIVSGLTLITASRALKSDANGLPVASAVTDTELGYVAGVTSAIQTQLNTKATDSLVVHLAGSETITGSKIFSSALTINPVTNQLILGTTNTTTISATAPSSSRTYTFPDIGANKNITLQLTAPGDSSVATRATQIFDYFDRADQTLNSTFTPTHTQWVLSGAGQTTATITSGAYIVTDNTYASLDYGAKITRIAGAFSFLPSTGADDITVECMALIADVVQIGLSTMLHLQFSPQGWNLVQYVTGTPTTILSGSHQCVRDGSVYSIAMEFSGNTVYVIPPQGPIQSYTNASIGSTTYRYGIWQITAAGTSSGAGSFGHWNAATLGYDVGRANRAIGQGLPASQIDFRGIQTNDTARAGFKGEWVQSSNPGVVTAGSTGTFKNYQTLDLTAGEWDVYGGIRMDGNGATTTGYQTALSLFSGNTTTDHVTGYNNIVTSFPSVVFNDSQTPMLSAFRVLVGTTTTVYLKMRWNFTLGTPQGDSGTIWARRAR